MEKERIKALEQLLNLDKKDIVISNCDDCILLIGKKEYLVVTDEEAEDEWYAHMESYVEDIIYPEIPEVYHFYFDKEKWINDAKGDGRGHSLALYDGVQNIEEVDGETYYIYRQN